MAAILCHQRAAGAIMSPDESENYVKVRTDIAELRGIVTGNLQGLQNAVERHDDEIRAMSSSNKVEFDQIHARQNAVQSETSSNTARITNLEGKSGRTPQWLALGVSALAALLAFGGAVQWAG